MFARVFFTVILLNDNEVNLMPILIKCSLQVNTNKIVYYQIQAVQFSPKRELPLPRIARLCNILKS